MTLPARLEAMKAAETYIWEQSDHLGTVLGICAQDAAETSDDLWARVGEHVVGVDRDLFLMGIHAFMAGFVHGYEQARDAE